MKEIKRVIYTPWWLELFASTLQGGLNLHSSLTSICPFIGGERSTYFFIFASELNTVPSK